MPLARRKELKKIWFTMKIVLSLGGLSKVETQKLHEARTQVKSRLAIVEKTAADEIADRRKLYEENDSMRDMFQLLWIVVSAYLEPKKQILSKWGYVKFNIIVQMALLGKEFDSSEAVELANADYDSDVASYGPLTKQAFFDLLAEMIDIWAEESRPRYYAAFTWALVDSIVDINATPPKFRNRKFIKGFVNMSEVAMLTKYSNSVREISKMYYWLDWYDSQGVSTESVARLANRRGIVPLDDKSKDILAILYTDQNRLDTSCVYFCDEEAVIAEGDDQNDGTVTNGVDNSSQDIHNNGGDGQTKTSSGTEDIGESYVQRATKMQDSFEPEPLDTESSASSRPFLFPRLKDSPLVESALMAKTRSSFVIATRLMTRARKARDTVIVRRQESILREEQLAQQAQDVAEAALKKSAEVEIKPISKWLKAVTRLVTVSSLCGRSWGGIPMSDDWPPENGDDDSDANSDNEVDDVGDVGKVVKYQRKLNRAAALNDKMGPCAARKLSAADAPPRFGPLNQLDHDSVDSDFKYTTKDSTFSATGAKRADDIHGQSTMGRDRQVHNQHSQYISSICCPYENPVYNHPPRATSAGISRSRVLSGGRSRSPVVRVNAEEAWRYHFDPKAKNVDTPPLKTPHRRVATMSRSKSAGSRPPRPTSQGGGRSNRRCNTAARPHTAAAALQQRQQSASCNVTAGYGNLGGTEPTATAGDVEAELVALIPEIIEDHDGNGGNQCNGRELFSPRTIRLLHCGGIMDAPGRSSSQPTPIHAKYMSVTKFDDEDLENGCGNESEFVVMVDVQVEPNLIGKKSKVGCGGRDESKKQCKVMTLPPAVGKAKVKERRKVFTGKASARPEMSIDRPHCACAVSKDMYSPTDFCASTTIPQTKEHDLQLPRYMRDTGHVKHISLLDMRSSFRQEATYFTDSS